MYDQETEDKAMARLMADLGRLPKPHKRTGPGVSWLVAGAMVALAGLVLLLAL